MNFKIELEQRESEVESAIKKYLPIEEGYQKRVIEAMNYSLLSGGKRLRPILMKESFELFGGKENTVLEPFMAALEMIHTYSLVHDDLPAMDNDDYRRGRKTTHVVYGEAMGILAGDGLLNFAFETACKAFERADNKETVAESLGILSQKAGIHGMIGGQVVDVASQGKELSLEEITFIYR
ncbi:MAG: polyprenyl synthetase family protein, partial [Acetivibrio sp.]